MSKKFPIRPANPGRICWGCDRYCAAESLQCGNGSVATPHPSELFGDDWMSWGLDARAPAGEAAGPAGTLAQ
ncbi:DUF3079 domain-containing protein [Roseateles sp. LYH14W]|uniref:DUF3079 domain-containing protein n=1 Tax=Pelomonas parva TaxID=3299032 RepID=A0ABW7F6H1_9BURK